MKSKIAAGMVAAMGFVLTFALVQMNHSGGDARRVQPDGDLAVQKIPPLPDSVTELKFTEFFVTPIGPRGLTLTEKLQGLDTKRVRMLGYMVRREEAPPGQFLLTALPVQLQEHDSGLADDLPPGAVHVSVPTCRDQQVPFAPGLMLLTGTLSVGSREEADGRISLVRLELDPPPCAATTKVPREGKGAGRPMQWAGSTPDARR